MRPRCTHRCRQTVHLQSTARSPGSTVWQSPTAVCSRPAPSCSSPQPRSANCSRYEHRLPLPCRALISAAQRAPTAPNRAAATPPPRSTASAHARSCTSLISSVIVACASALSQHFLSGRAPQLWCCCRPLPNGGAIFHRRPADVTRAAASAAGLAAAQPRSLESSYKPRVRILDSWPPRHRPSARTAASDTIVFSPDPSWEPWP
jgi:hypothetical protein